MSNLTDHRLPFVMNLPSNCKIIMEQNPFSRSEPCIEVFGPSEFYFNLIWGKAGNINPDIPPPGYFFLEHKTFGKFGNTGGIVAVLPALSPINIIIRTIQAIIPAVLFGIIALVICFFAKLDFKYVLWGALVVYGYFWLSMICKVKKYIKYAFIYKDVEYIFTGSFNQKEALDDCLNSIMFIM